VTDWMQGGEHAASSGEGDACVCSDLSVKDLHFIVTFQRTCAPNQFLHLAHSLCPSILGHDMVKLGLVLALMGTCRRNENASRGVAVRGNSHVLLIGDPGLGKSQLLRAAAAASPHGFFVNSMSSTSAGLTVSVSKDVVTNDMAFEAGALVLADNGVCCLDELDNMKSEHTTLLEVMEQQEVRLQHAWRGPRQPPKLE
jgi:DNA helicase MCM8